ncbi:transcriptional activator, Rgg/GadR/MutR family, C-terminal domain-containing protein [Pilibacter termitis]|uniref:Transcriptional activator, Rgg/GadR/MutR family, C-terminal domain-containing protein n=1 Tax=Pilibacter termitis TaxID=263852 RepID=A0A1T4LKJ1_9ENTE|nr:transcriptional activator, Rgg/GadR/MutR family, C-terminal domain-containing protein [Pilibacter termitis]
MKEYALSEEEKQKISTYLFSIEEWGVYQLLLYLNSMATFNVEMILSLSKDLLSRTSFYKVIPKNRRLIIRILLNSITVFLENRNMRYAKYFREIVKELLSNEQEIYEKTVFLFTSGAVDFYCGEQEVGKTQMLDAIKVFEITGCSNLAQNYKKDFDEIVKGTSKKSCSS